MLEVENVKTKGYNMQNIVIKVKKLDREAILPESNTETDVGYDIYAIDEPEVKEKNGIIQYIQYRTGIAIEPPEGYHVEIFPRSSISKYDLVLANSVGLIDFGYRGEILIRFKYIDPIRYVEEIEKLPLKVYEKGNKIAQLVIRKTERAVFELVEELSETKRASGGFGSSGS